MRYRAYPSSSRVDTLSTHAHLCGNQPVSRVHPAYALPAAPAPSAWVNADAPSASAATRRAIVSRPARGVDVVSARAAWALAVCVCAAAVRPRPRRRRRLARRGLWRRSARVAAVRRGGRGGGAISGVPCVARAGG